MTAGLLQDLDVIEVVRTLQAHDGVDCEIREVILVVRYELGAKRRPSDAQEVLSEFGLVRAVVDRGRLQRVARGLSGKAPSLGDRLGMDALIDETLGLAPFSEGGVGDGLKWDEGRFSATDKMRTTISKTTIGENSQQLSAEYGHARGAIPDLVVLHPSDVHQDLRGGVVEVDRLQYRCAVVRYAHALVVFRNSLQYLVHTLRT